MCVAAAQAQILGPEDVYVKKGSTISLTCSVNVQSTPPSSVSWHHGRAVLDFNSPRYKPRESSSRVLSVMLLTPLASLSLSLSYPSISFRDLVEKERAENKLRTYRSFNTIIAAHIL